MSKRQREQGDTFMTEQSLGPRSAKRKAVDMMAAESAKKQAESEKRKESKRLRAEVDDLAGLFGKMKSSDEPSGVEPSGDVNMEGRGRRRRRTHTRKHKKSKKSKKTRKH